MKRKFLLFCFVGFVGAIFELSVFNLMLPFWDFGIAKAVSLFFSVSLAFVINRRFTFLAESGDMQRQAVRYLVIYSVAIVVNFTTSILLSEVFGPGLFNSNLATVLGILAAVPLTFFGSLYWVFIKAGK